MQWFVCDHTEAVSLILRLMGKQWIKLPLLLYFCHVAIVPVLRCCQGDRDNGIAIWTNGVKEGLWNQWRVCHIDSRQQQFMLLKLLIWNLGFNPCGNYVSLKVCYISDDFHFPGHKQEDKHKKIWYISSVTKGNVNNLKLNSLSQACLRIHASSEV